MVARAPTHTYTLNTYLRKLESWDQYGGMCWCLVFVCARENTPIHTNTHRVHLPTLGLDGQVYVCMCMGRYSV